MLSMRRGVGDERSRETSVSLHPYDREMLELYAYSSIWHGLGVAALNHFMFHIASDKVALMIGMGIPFVLGTSYVLSSHRSLAGFMTSVANVSDYKTVRDSGDQEAEEEGEE